jgi:cytochrome c-type biogenesis protein
MGSRAGFLTAVLALICLLPRPASAIAVGDRAPDFTLTDQNGVSHSLSGSAGKVRLIYFFGHSAPVCAETARQIGSDFESGYGAKGLVILALDCWDGTEQQLRGFATANGVSYPLLGNAGVTASQYDLPYQSFVVLDTGGVVRLVIQGPDASAYDRDRIEKTVKSLLQNPSATEEQTWGAIKALFSR